MNINQDIYCNMKWLKVSPLISDGAILQHGVTVPVPGESLPMSHITLSFLGKEYSAQADGNGKWMVSLDSHAPGGPHSMKISAVAGDNPETDKISINDIYFGDVWICSGQSNMELPMRRVQDDFPEEWDAPNPLIRQFTVPQEWDFSGPRQWLSGGRWMAAGADTLHEFFATAWFFARQIFEKQNYPIGIIAAAWGGTPVEAWMSGDALAAFPEKIALGKKHADPVYCGELARKTEAEIQAWNGRLASDAGLANAWHSLGDYSQWDKITLPGAFTGEGIDRLNGVVWLHKEFDTDKVGADLVSADFTGSEAKIWLGTIIDADTVYINGCQVGTTDYRYPPRKYTVPAGLLRKGKNQIVIRVICQNGGGGITLDKDFRIFTESCNIELGGVWDYRVGISLPEPCPANFFFQRQPLGLFNAMISPLLGHPCRGVLWYQGESNDPNPDEYSSLFISMINDWRDKQRLLQGGELPFLFVQLPLYGEPAENNESNSWAIIREAQRSALSLPATGMAVGLDLGEWNDLHPVNKKGVGSRLALAAEQVVYKNRNTAPGPLYRCTRQDKGRLFFTFDNCGAGLTASETPYVSVIAGGEIFRLPADIESPECLSVDISGIKNPEKVLYAWAGNPRDRQLYNADGLPAIPFRVDVTPSA
jgi:sialate O-acetylesterase